MFPARPSAWPLLLCLGCSASHNAAVDGGSRPHLDAGDASRHMPDAGFDAPRTRDALADGPADVIVDVNKAKTCSPTFGDALTNAFGRFDGTVVAVVPPADDACALPNSTHLVLQVSMDGAVYRMVLDVLSSSGDPNVYFYEEDAPLAAGPWAAGWHAGVGLDYVTTLGLHAAAFTSMPEAALVDKVTGEIQVGSHVSVFATSAGESNSAHLIHRNLTNQDGAIVLSPESASPHYLLFRFSEQTF